MSQPQADLQETCFPDPQLAVKLALLEMDYIRMQAGLPPVDSQPANESFLRDLSPMGR